MPAKRKSTNIVQLRTNVSPELYKLIKDFQRQNELAYESDVVRMAIANFLKGQDNLHFNNFKNQKK